MLLRSMEEAVVEAKEVPLEEVEDEEDEEEGCRERRPPCGGKWVGKGRGREAGWLGKGGGSGLIWIGLKDGKACWVPIYRRTEKGGGWLLWRGRGKGQATHAAHT